MSISQSLDVRDGVYVPWRTAKRGGINGGDPVGTVSVDGGLTGDATAGTAAIIIRMSRDTFGFPIIMIPTHLSARDNLASPEVVRLAYVTQGNERMVGDIEQHVLALAGAAALNVANFDSLGIPIEGQGVDQIILQVTWSTNTDTKVYHAHVFGYVYDAQLIAREGRVEGRLAGLT